MEDFVKSVKAQLYDRVSSPLFFSFVISWLLWNYRFVLIVLSDTSVSQKFNMIDTQIFPDWEVSLFKGVFLPLVSSLIYLFLYPYPAWHVFRHIRMQQKRLKELQQEIDDETPLTREEARSLRVLVRSAADEQDRIAAEKDGIIRDLKAEIENMQSESSEGDARPTESQRRETSPLDEIQKSIMHILADDEGFVDSHIIFSKIQEKRLHVQHAIDKLKDLDYIEEEMFSNEPAFQLSPDGRDHYVEFLDEEGEPN